MKKLIKQILALLWAKRNFKFFQKRVLINADLEKLQRTIESLTFEKYIPPIELNVPTNKKILIIAPHPDDEVLGCGGYLIRAKEKGCELYLVSLTLGSENESIQRQSELEAVMSELSIDRHLSLNWRQNCIREELSQSDSVEKKIEEYNPDQILIPFILDNHPDHIDSNLVMTKLNGNINCEVLCYQVYSNILTNTYLDITNIAEKKYSLMNNYKSQVDNFDFINWNRGLCAWNSRHAKNKEQKLIESYFTIPIDDYIKVCKNYFN